MDKDTQYDTTRDRNGELGTIGKCCGGDSEASMNKISRIGERRRERGVDERGAIVDHRR